jgi:hypothetical protein
VLVELQVLQFSQMAVLALVQFFLQFHLMAVEVAVLTE